MLGSSSLVKVNAYIDTIFQAAILKNTRTLDAVKKVFNLDTGYFTANSPAFYSASFLLASNNRNESILHLKETSNLNKNFVSQALAYYLSNGIYNAANDLLNSDNHLYKACYFESLDNMFNFLDKSISTSDLSNILQFFTSEKHLSEQQKFILISKILIFQFINHGDQALFNTCQLLPLSTQTKAIFDCMIMLLTRHQPNILHGFINTLSRSNIRSFFSNNIEKWLWEYFLENGHKFGAIASFLSNNLSDRIAQYRYAFQKYHSTSNYNEFQYTLSFIDAHEGDQAELVKSNIFESLSDLSAYRPKSLDELPHRLNNIRN